MISKKKCCLYFKIVIKEFAKVLVTGVKPFLLFVSVFNPSMEFLFTEDIVKTDIKQQEVSFVSVTSRASC